MLMALHCATTSTAPRSREESENGRGTCMSLVLFRHAGADPVVAGCDGVVPHGSTFPVQQQGVCTQGRSQANSSMFSQNRHAVRPNSAEWRGTPLRASKKTRSCCAVACCCREGVGFLCVCGGGVYHRCKARTTKMVLPWARRWAIAFNGQSLDAWGTHIGEHRRLGTDRHCTFWNSLQSTRTHLGQEGGVEGGRPARRRPRPASGQGPRQRRRQAPRKPPEGAEEKRAKLSRGGWSWPWRGPGAPPPSRPGCRSPGQRGGH